MTAKIFADYDMISDVIASRPATPTVAAGRLCVFQATDTGKIYIWNGSAWKIIPVTSTDLSDVSGGNWTPTDASGAGLALTINSAKFVHIGIFGFFAADITYPATGSGLGAAIGNMPIGFASTSDPPFYTSALATFGLMPCIAGNTFVPLFTQAGVQLTNSQLTGATCRLSTVVVTP